MSGLRVPVFFGSILSLVVVVLQNLTPAYQLTLLGVRLRPLPLGMWVAGAVLSGVVLGTVFQRLGRRSRPSVKPKAPSRDGTGLPEFQTFRSTPEPQDDSADDAFDFDDVEDDFESEHDQHDPPESLDETGTTRTSSAKGWDTNAPSSWTEKGDESAGGFWSRPAKPKSRPKRTGLASVTSINSDRNSQKPQKFRNRQEDDRDPSMVDAEYRIVTPYSRESTDDFDDDFFDDFFDEEKS